MEKKERYKYFRVPISLLRGLADNTKETLLNCAYYGVYSLTETKKVTNKEERTFIEQFIYSYYNDPDSLTLKLDEKMEEAIDEGMFHVDEDHKGFAAGEGRRLNVDSEVHDLERIFEDDKEFQDMVLKFGKARAAFRFYEMKKDFSYIFDWAPEMEKTIPDNSPMVMIPQIKLNEFLSDDTKTEFDLMTFATYLAIRSILGTKTNCRTTKEMILARAFGFRNMDELRLNPPTLFEKYSKRYWIDKLLAEVSETWGIHVYSTNDGLRGMYVGHGISADDFGYYVAERMKAKDPKHRKKVMNKRIREKIEKLKNDDLNDLA